MTETTVSIDNLMDWSDIGHEIFISHSMSDTYLRSLANKCLPYIEKLASSAYIHKLNINQLKKLIHDCELAIMRYNDKTNHRAVHWKKLVVKFEKAMVIKEREMSGEFDVEAMAEAIGRCQGRANSEYKYAELLVTCNKAIKLYKNDQPWNFGREMPEYFTWCGFKHYILDCIDTAIYFAKEHIESDQELIKSYTKDIKRYKEKVMKNNHLLELLSDCIENPDQMENKPPVQLVESDGSCDGCYFVGEDSCPKDKCEAGKMIFEYKY